MPSTLINGSVGQLEILAEPPKTLSARTPVAIICHPHPLYGGTMQNKVVHTVAKSCMELGMPAIRFNFRGVGASEGHFEHGLGEQQDCIAVAQWARQQYPNRPIWLAGFSFGSFVAYQVFAKIKAERLLLVAPPVGLFEFRPMDSINIPWCVIQGKQDEITSPGSVEAWVNKQPTPPEFYYLDDVSHFFHGKLGVLREIIAKIWKDS
ncbi:Alpha/beta hydrolase [hydrothermal vent metagenome]|uniref:Alpha/beta hydrolase n=1 Tax=hydrothermal vent metagenome TaxID=652676 RepID=A0A3B1A9H5_9ZZZZ